MDAHALGITAWKTLPAGRSSVRMTPCRDEDFERCWAEVSPELLALAAVLGIPASRGQDLLHDAYLTALVKRPQDIAPPDLRRWLFRVLANRCRLERRQQRQWSSAWNKLCHWWAGENSDRNDLTNELQQHVGKALNELDPQQREIIVLRYFAEFNATEIGEMLELPAATVRSHLARARRRLAQHLADWNDNHE